jgi:transketolase
VPSFETFNLQTELYKGQIMNETKHKISIEAGVTEPWKKYVGENGICFGVDDFGKSAPGKDVFESFYLNSDYIVTQIEAMLDK